MSNLHRLLSASAFVALLSGAIGLSSVHPQAAPPSQDSFAKIQPLLSKYCYKCHGAGAKPKADLNLTNFSSEAAIRGNRKIWKEVLNKTLTKEMPPDDAQPQPTQEERDTLTKFVQSALNKVDLNAPKVAGRVVARRLNRTEYRNTVRDLLGVDFNPVGDFPSDDIGYGFDNIGDVLSMPPLLFEKYLAAAKKIAEQAVTGKEKDKHIFITRPGATPDAAGAKPKTPRDFAKEVLTRLAFKGFRRPPQTDEIERLLKLFDVGEKTEGGDFEKAMKLPIRGLLISPHFLFRVEPEQGADTYPLGPYEVASRMSYYLWSSMPDDELLDAAKSGKLLDPKVLEAQTRRMIEDPKSYSLAENFAPQWLQIRRLEDMRFDAAKFPGIDASLKKDMIQEAVLFFHEVMTQDFTILVFVDVNFTFLNDRLARHYGLPGPGGSGFQKVKLSDPRRGGVLTMAAVLAATSDPDRTSLVKRGKWVLETILATPPPPPIPDAANLKDDPENLKLPLRQRMEKHRTDPNCASCHKRMDPIGFALENYDAIGAWRDQDQGKPIDTMAEFPDGKKVNGVLELKKMLWAKKAEFVEGFTEKMLTFALGRGVEYYDGAVVKTIADACAKNDYSMTTLMVEVVKSYPFLNRQRDRGKK